MAEQLDREIKDFDQKIKALKSAKEINVKTTQKVMRQIWSDESETPEGSRCVIGPKMYEVGIRFNPYSPSQMSVNVYELTKANKKKETYGSYKLLGSFIEKHPNVPFTRPTDSGYAKLGTMNPKSLKSYQGFRVGQEVSWKTFDGWHSVSHKGIVNNFTSTGKVTVTYGHNNAKVTLRISDIKPVDKEA